MKLFPEKVIKLTLAAMAGLPPHTYERYNLLYTDFNVSRFLEAIIPAIYSHVPQGEVLILNSEGFVMGEIHDFGVLDYIQDHPKDEFYTVTVDEPTYNLLLEILNI